VQHPRGAGFNLSAASRNGRDERFRKDGGELGADLVTSSSKTRTRISYSSTIMSGSGMST
jgi:hypothetical protein